MGELNRERGDGRWTHGATTSSSGSSRAGRSRLSLVSGGSARAGGSDGSGHSTDTVLTGCSVGSLGSMVALQEERGSVRRSAPDRVAPQAGGRPHTHSVSLQSWKSGCAALSGHALQAWGSLGSTVTWGAGVSLGGGGGTG